MAPSSDLDIHVRPLDGHDEYRACEAFQRDVWGADFREIAPASLLKIGQRLGGVSSGAFHPEDGLVGFVFGLTGLEDGRPVHWSHMLAVREAHRNRGLGRRLKEHQRALLLERGVEQMYWTFDPLVARNAHFNLNRLGVRVVEYVPDMYGETGSQLHEGLDTDRLVVAWQLEGYEPAGDRTPESRSGAGGRPEAGAPADAEGGAARPGGEPGPTAAERDIPRPDGVPAAEVPFGGDASTPPVVRVEVPADIHALRSSDPDAAARWRERTREAFLGRLDSGYRVSGFVPGPERGFYVLLHERVDAHRRSGDDPDAGGPADDRAGAGGEGRDGGAEDAEEADESVRDG